jgi:hypothetical protein
MTSKLENMGIEASFAAAEEILLSEVYLYFFINI